MSAILRKKYSQRGATLVEAALALPPILALAILSICLVELSVSHLLIHDNIRQASRAAARVQPDGVNPIESLRRARLINELRNLERFGMRIENEQINSVAEGYFFQVELSNTCHLCRALGIAPREVFTSTLFPLT